jgi:hypothetical protein
MSNPKTPAVDWLRVGLGKKFDSQVAKETGVPRRQVTKIRTRLGIPSYSETKTGVKPSRNRRVDAAQPATKPITQVIAQTPIEPAKKPPKAAEPKKVGLKNYVAVVLDKSSSIQYYQIENTLREAYNGLVDTIKKNAEESGQETVFSLFQFGSRVSHSVVDVPASKIEKLTSSTYRATDGSTCLLDGVGAAISYLKDRPDANAENVSHLIVVLTDGEENSSQTFKPDDIRANDKKSTKLLNLISECQYAGNWTLAFQLPEGFKKKFVDAYGIPADNVREWAQTDAGVKETFERTSGGVTQYFNSRASGQASVQKFYATTDLSKIKPKDIHAKLDDVSDRFKDYTLEREYVVKEAMETKTRKPFVIGAVYYELMKPEEVQPQKEVLIVERGKKSVWGGDQARQLIGLPKGVSAKVKPGNHANYQIFVQSQSVNRILPRGTRIMVDTRKLVDDNPTWDHTKVAQQ